LSKKIFGPTTLSQISLFYLTLNDFIASEQNWNHIETIDSLMRKGGYKSPITNDIRNNVAVTRYQSEKLTRSFNDWKNAKAN
jgi:nucleoid-associated protein YgaU